MYELRILDDAGKDLAKLDKPVGRRIMRRLKWLGEHLDEIQLESLTGRLAGLNKLRVGDYRVIYGVLANERKIVVHAAGHRRGRG